MGLSFVIVMLMSSYFIASYFMSLRIFNSIPEMMTALSVIYFKGSGIESLLSFYRENLIRNTTLNMYEDQT